MEPNQALTSANLAVIAKRESALLALAGSKTYFEKIENFRLYAGTYFASDSQAAIKCNSGTTIAGTVDSAGTTMVLDRHHSFVVQTKVDDGIEKLLQKQFSSLGIKKPVKYKWYLMLFALAFLLIPMKQSITTQANVISDLNSVQISVRSPGILSEIEVKAGKVNKQQVIAKLSNTNTTQLQEAQAQLNMIENQILEQGAFSAIDINQLSYEKKRLRALVNRLKLDIIGNTINAPVTGLIEWESNIVGARVQEGQIIGTISPESQKYVTAMINVKDSIDNKIGDSADFIVSKSLKAVKGRIVSISHSPTLIDGQLKLKVLIKTEIALITGTTGYVTLTGDETTIGGWFFKIPLLRAKAFFLAF